MRILALLLLVEAAHCFAQSRGIEVFGSIGAMRAGGDEGYNGSGVIYGGAVTLPFADRWAVDIQAMATRPENRPDFRLSRVLLSPALQYRRGSDRAKWFIAFGPGWQRDRTSSTFQIFDGTGQASTVSFNGKESGLTLHWRTGAVFQPAKRLLIRGEFFWANRYVLPNVGVAISLGVRLGR